MKKIFLMAAVAFCSIQSYAQISFGGQIGVNLGMGQNNVNAVTAAITNDPKVGFEIGAVADIHIFGKLDFRPELNFVQKGSKAGAYYAGGSYYAYSVKRTLNYFELPLNVVYKMSFNGSKNQLFFGAGPSFGVGLFGADKPANGSKVTIKFDDNSNSNASDEHLKRLDIGVNILAGYQLDMGVFARVSYTHGLPDIDPENNKTYRNRGVSLTIGYMLGSKKK